MSPSVHSGPSCGGREAAGSPENRPCSGDLSLVSSPEAAGAGQCPEIKVTDVPVSTARESLDSVPKHRESSAPSPVGQEVTEPRGVTAEHQVRQQEGSGFLKSFCADLESIDTLCPDWLKASFLQPRDGLEDSRSFERLPGGPAFPTTVFRQCSSSFPPVSLSAFNYPWSTRVQKAQMQNSQNRQFVSFKSPALLLSIVMKSRASL